MASGSLQTLSEIFNDKFFRVPDYQRGYSWEKEHRDDFWQDLNNLDNSRIHYVGMITIEYKDGWNYIIDGQQRIATIMILLKTILDRFDDEDYVSEYSKKSDLVKKYLYKQSGKNEQIQNAIFGYEQDNPSNIYYRRHILGLNITDYHPEEIHTSYTKNLQNAFDEFQKKVKSLNETALKALINKITKQLKFSLYEIETNEGLDEFIIFETMNNRGKQLTTLELLKNRLIYLTTLLRANSEDEKEKLRTDISNVWKTIYEYIGKDESGEIKDDEFLKDHWRMYFKGAHNRAVANPEREFLLRRYFIINRISGNSCINNESWYQQLREEQSEKERILRLINYKQNTGDPNNINVMSEIARLKKQLQEMELLQKEAETIDKKYLEYNDIKEYIDSLQKMIVSYYKMFNPSDFDVDIQKWLLKLNRLPYATFRPLLMCILADYKDSRKNKIVEILRRIEGYIFVKLIMSKGNSAIVAYFYILANKYHEMRDIDYVVKELNNYCQKNVRFDENTFQGMIVYDEETNSKGWYSWRGITYLLYEYELYLQEKRIGEEKLNWKDASKNNIEHIYPQSPTNSEWSDFDSLDSNKQYCLLHSLGNLLLLSARDNSAVGNKSFVQKKEIYKTANYSAIEVSQNDNWTPETIAERGMKILEFVQNRWWVQMSDNTINNILGV
ncbi:MAG: DUF262 domain-containing HNH endonuclease family protein [Campylobacteraceae bacterium]|nr:DUF262 domain-containing HNH endonuclease family protein [Campylobacteraceae bacterium]